MPIKNGCIDQFFNFVNVKTDRDKLLLKLFIVTSFIPDIPHKILLIYGPKGSGKSGLLRTLLKLIDPTPLYDISMKKIEDFYLVANQRWVIGIDNISRLSLNDSDVLCKLTTGGGFCKRNLYTNDSLMVMKLRNVLILNGIPNVAEKPDLLDRSLLVEMQSIDSSNRRTEDELDSDYEIVLPEILGGILNTLSEAMRLYPSIKPKTLHRMADFHRWALAAGQAMNYSETEIEDALNSNYALQIEAATDSSWLAQLIVDYVTERALYEGTAAELLSELRKFNDDQRLPYHFQITRLQPNRLTPELSRLTEVLHSHGVRYEKHTRGDKRTFSISMNQKTRDLRRKSLKSIDGTVGDQSPTWENFNKTTVDPVDEFSFGDSST